MALHKGTAEVPGVTHPPANVDDDVIDRGDAVLEPKSRRHVLLYSLLGAAAIFLAALVAGIAALIYPAFPRVLVMATGSEGGAYAEYGQRYQEIFARQGVRLTLLHTRGSVENLNMLRYRDFDASIALVQSGIANPDQSPDLASLGTVAIEPEWIFCRCPQPHAGLAHLRGLRVSIGPTGSGMRRLALELLRQNGIDESNTELLFFPATETAERLIAGDIDAAMMTAAPEAPAIRRLLASRDIELLPLTHAEAYVARLPFLARVILPAGYVDMAANQPSTDIEMVAVKTNLVVRRELPSAVQYLLLDAAAQIHAHPGVFQRAGEFPANEASDLPLSDDARQFYRSGLPMLQRYLPLWLAILTQQLAITLLPMVAVAYPLLRAVPAVYGWGMRRRIYRLYGELKLLELAIEDQSRDRRRAVLSALSRLEHRVQHLRLPTNFAHLLYTLRQDIELVRARLNAGDSAHSTRQRASNPDPHS